MATLPDKKINPAKRGDLFVFPTYSSCTYLHGPTERSVSYVLAVVTSITREGLIKGYRVAGESLDSRNTPAESRLIQAKRIRTDAAMTAYVTRHDGDRAFKSLDEAVAFLKPFLK